LSYFPWVAGAGAYVFVRPTKWFQAIQ